MKGKTIKTDVFPFDTHFMTTTKNNVAESVSCHLLKKQSSPYVFNFTFVIPHFLRKNETFINGQENHLVVILFMSPKIILKIRRNVFLL